MQSYKNNNQTNIFNNILLLLTLVILIINRTQASQLNSVRPNLINQTIEKKMGQKIMNQLFKSNAVLLDPISKHYIQHLGKKLTQKSSLPNSNFFFFIVDDKQINAFALPGGFIGINLGLIHLTQSESELAGVMAHEIGHVTQNHITRMLKKLDKLTLPMLLGVLGAGLASMQNPTIGQAALMSVLAGSQQSTINFTRAHEQEADRIALPLLYSANYNPFALPSFFNRMHSAHQYSQSSFPEFLRTHPIDKKRVTDTIARAKQLPIREYHESSNYSLIKERINNLMQHPTASQLPYYEHLQIHKPKDFTKFKHYGYILELLRNNKFKQANEQALILNTRAPEQPLFKMILAETYNHLNQSKRALQILEILYHSIPNYPPLTLLYAELLLKNNHHKEATLILKKALSDQTTFPQMYQLLAKSAYAQNKITEMHENQANYFYHVGQYSMAINQLEHAIKSTKSTYYTALLKTKLKLAKQHLKLIKK